MTRQLYMVNYKDKQAGNTFLGVIIGLIIGLLIAVVIALVITKSPVPFVNRMAKDKVSDPTPNQMTDPNKSLYGNKGGAKDITKEPVPVQQTDTKAVPVPPAKEVAKAPVIEKSPVEKPKDAIAKQDSLEDKYTFYLQVGAFREQPDAETAKAKLALQGFEAQVSERASESGILYRVRLGPYSQIEAMNKVRSKLSESGVDVAVVRIPK